MHLAPGGPTFWVGDEPDVVGSDLEVVDLLGDVGEVFWEIDVPRN